MCWYFGTHALKTKGTKDKTKQEKAWIWGEYEVKGCLDIRLMISWYNKKKRWRKVEK